MYPYRIQKVRWAESPSGGSFQVTLKVVTVGEGTSISAVTDVVNTFRTSIRSFNVVENRRTGTYEITLKILVPSNLELDKVLSQLKLLKAVYKVTRV